MILDDDIRDAKKWRVPTLKKFIHEKVAEIKIAIKIKVSIDEVFLKEDLDVIAKGEVESRSIEEK